jgi:hypothetical protein
MITTAKASMFNFERLKKTGKQITKAAVTTANGIKAASDKLVEATICSVKITGELANTVVVEPTVNALKQLWPAMDIDNQSTELSSSDNNNMALFRTAMDGGINQLYFYRLLKVSVTDKADKPYFHKLKNTCVKRKSSILKNCKNCNIVLCGIFCCDDCKKNVKSVEEAYGFLTMEKLQRIKESEIYFIKHAIVYEQEIKYNW